MSQTEYEAAVAEFIRKKGVTRCPTACLAPTQGSVAAADQAALRRRAQEHEELLEERRRALAGLWVGPQQTAHAALGDR